MAKVKIQDGMCFTIEPGLYNENHFGIRLENSCYMQNGQIHSFTNMNYEKKLIDFSLLNEHEKEWLKEFEVI
jgi:Xaa-Pro aminopeptidase